MDLDLLMNQMNDVVEILACKSHFYSFLFDVPFPRALLHVIKSEFCKIKTTDSLCITHVI